LHLLLRSFDHIKSHLPEGTEVPKLVFVGDGPARQELERLCVEKGIDATFMGHRSGEDLAACYASADFFVFPSFTEVSGLVILLLTCRRSAKSSSRLSHLVS
jgi:glycosyltransferase involved in cell wall biosynthesis